MRASFAQTRSISGSGWSKSVRAAKGKGLRADCAGFSYGREREILLLQEELQSGTYRHGPCRAFAVRDPKVREVKAALPRGGHPP